MTLTTIVSIVPVQLQKLSIDHLPVPFQSSFITVSTSYSNHHSIQDEHASDIEDAHWISAHTYD